MLQGVVDSAVSSDAAVKPVNPDAAVSSDVAVGEDLAHKERKRIIELIQSRGMPHGSYPQFDVAVKGQKVVLLSQTFRPYHCCLLVLENIIFFQRFYKSELILHFISNWATRL